MDDALIATAGEFVLGTLSREEHAAFVLRIANDPAAARAVADWRQRLAPLAAGAPERIPPAGVWPAIERRLGKAAANDNRVSAAWRSGAIAASLAALILAGVQFRPSTPIVPPVAAPAPVAASYVAAVTREGAEPALLVTVDPKSGKAVIRAIGLTPPDKKSLELWYIGGGRDPASLGLVSGDGRTEKMLTDAMARGDKLDASQFAVTVEPIGGAPGGKASGPIVYSGKPVRVSGT